uniref:Uncharacterized protein n=1 Tax=Anguilla anguilla TaxID=7936 RepID=A0A0E9V830_ANGAN
MQSDIDGISYFDVRMLIYSIIG